VHARSHAVLCVLHNNNDNNNRDVAAYFRKAHAGDPLYLPAITYHCIKGCADAAVIVELCCVTATHALAAQCIEVRPAGTLLRLVVYMANMDICVHLLAVHSVQHSSVVSYCSSSTLRMCLHAYNI
jgi:hypothetical protein